MYQQHPQQQGSQSFPNQSMPPHHQPPVNQLSNRPNMQGMGFQFPRPTQLPEELESALAIRSTRDMDHRQMDHINASNQGSDSGQLGGYGPNSMSHSVDNQPGHQQGMDWTSYQPPNKLYAPPPNIGHQGVQQAPQPRQSHGGAGDSQSFYTPESAGSILASFGLSNEDLEVLSHYPDDQLTPDTLPFILRDIQINKSSNQKKMASTSSSTFPQSIHEMPAPSSDSGEVPSLLTVTQTAGKVIDYGHASRGKDKSSPRETFKREQLSNERTIKMFPASSPPTVSKMERRVVNLEHKEPSKREDRDYRRTGSEKRKNSQSPGREFSHSPKPRKLDRDYRHEGSRQRPSSETRSEASSRRSLSSSSGSKTHGRSKKLPSPSMISDFQAVCPTVFPHTCSLCHLQCDQDKDWVAHINTVDHTAACRDLRNKYPDWKPICQSRSGRYGSRALWDPRDGSPFRTVSRPDSRSPSPRHHVDTHARRRPYSPHRHPRTTHYPERSYRFGYHHPSSSHNSYPYQASSHSRETWSERNIRHPSGYVPRRNLKRPHDDFSRSYADSGYAFYTSVVSSKHPPSKSVKGATKPTLKVTKTVVKPSLAKKKKTVVATHQYPDFQDCLVYLTGIPTDATEQEVTDLVGSFGKINNVILMACSEENEKDLGQKASVCMMKAVDARALASSPNLSIREKQITASVAKKSDDSAASDADSKPAQDQDKGSASKAAEGDTIDKTDDQKCKVLITGLPEAGCSENDVKELVQSYETSSSIVLAAHVGKALVSLPNLDVAEEMVKVNNFKPAKINGNEVKMTLVKQDISLSTPVALYNIFMGPTDPLESSDLVGWNSLLVIKNVPDTPSGSSEVLKLVRRFGTVIKTLVLNGMVICEMATTAMAFSVFKRFQMFPCIIQSNPLFFHRKPDPKASAQAKVAAAQRDASEVKPATDDGGRAEEDAPPARDEKPEPAAEERGAEGDGKPEKTTEEEPAKESDEIKKEEGGKSEDAEEARACEEVIGAGTSEEGKGDEESTSAGEAAQTSQTDDASNHEAMPVHQLPKMTQAMVNALLEECRTRTSGGKTAAPPPTAAGKPTEPPEQGETRAETDEAAPLEEASQARKDRDYRKEKEIRERERREKERRAWEKERREKARKEKERREEERRRKEKRRIYEGESRSSYRPGWRDSEEECRKAEEKPSDDFPFNMSDFVTLDEVGDVTDVPLPTDAMEMPPNEDPAAGETNAEEKPMEVTMETSDEKPSKSEDASESVGEVPADLDPVPSEPPPPSPQAEASTGQTVVQPDEEPEAQLLDSTTNVEPQSVPAENSSCISPTDVVVKNEEAALPHEEVNAPVKQEEAAAAEKQETVENQNNTEQKQAESELKLDVSTKTERTLPPYDPSKPVGLEYLVPKSGFFCKPCARFFSGEKVAEINHCKTFKHYENLQKFLQKTKG